ncbi:MAG: AraC family transcriptional regulator [Kofleriaceae bacterium]
MRFLDAPEVRYGSRVLIDARTFRTLVTARDLLASEEHDADTVRAIAERLGESPYQLIRRFAAVYGTTPHQFRTQARLARAKRLLAAGTPVTDVCMEVGFSSLGSFSALFTRWVGSSPMRYRRAVQVPRTSMPVIPGCFGLLAAMPSRNSREASRA